MGGQNARISRHSGVDKLAGAFSGQGLGALGPGQYGWPECKDFQAFCGGKDGLEHFSCRVVAA